MDRLGSSLEYRRMLQRAKLCTSRLPRVEAQSFTEKVGDALTERAGVVGLLCGASERAAASRRKRIARLRVR